MLNRQIGKEANTFIWLLDLLCHWQNLFVVGLMCGLLLAFFWDKKWLITAILLPLPWLTAAPQLPQHQQEQKGSDLQVVSFNLHAETRDIGRLAPWLAQIKPDIVVLLEVSPALAAQLPSLKQYPYQIVNADDSPFGIALLSKWPIQTSALVPDENGINNIELEILWGKQLINVLAVHPMPPLSAGFHQSRNRQFQAMVQKFAAKGTPALMIGDLNATPWSSAFLAFEHYGWRRSTGLLPTWPAWGQGLIGIPIDHVIASPHWLRQTAAIGPDLGSDHLPIHVQLSLIAQGQS